MRTFFVMAGAIALSGCASISNVQMADTLGTGNFQIGIEPGVLGAPSTLPGALPQASPFAPHVDVSARFGVSEGVDLGFRAGMSFLEAQGKFLFTRPGDPNLAVSFAPTVGGLIIGSGNASLGVLNIGVPVLIGIKTRGGSEFVIGPRLQNTLMFGSDASAGGGVIYGLAPGGSLGFAWRITDNFALLPEVSAVVPVLGAASFGTGLVASGSGSTSNVLVQFKLGVLLGRFRRLPQNDALRQAPPPGPPQRIANPPLPPPQDGMTPPPPPPPSP